MEFREYLPPNTSSVLLQPLGTDGLLVAGSDRQRGFAPLDQVRLQLLKTWCQLTRQLQVHCFPSPWCEAVAPAAVSHELQVPACTPAAIACLSMSFSCCHQRLSRLGVIAEARCAGVAGLTGTEDRCQPG